MASHVHSQCLRYVVVREHFDFLGQVSDIRDKEGPSLRLKATVVDNRQIIELKITSGGVFIRRCCDDGQSSQAIVINRYRSSQVGLYCNINY